MKRINIIIICLVIFSGIISTFIIYDKTTENNAPTILNTQEPSELCAIFDRTWNSYTNTCDYMSEVECGFSLGEWNECALFENYCNPSNTLCEAPDSCISACIFESSMPPLPMDRGDP